MIGLRRKCWQIKRFLLQISSQHQQFSEKVFLKENRDGKERQHVLRTKTDGNNGLLQSIQNTSFYFFLSLMWLEFISLMCFHHHHCRNVHILKPFCKSYFIWTKKEEKICVAFAIVSS